MKNLLVRKVPYGYQIHHIDHNRKNNNICNLVAIPKKLHNNYHSCNNKFQKSLYDINNFFGFMHKGHKEKTFNHIDNFMNVKNELLSYMNIRDFKINFNNL